MPKIKIDCCGNGPKGMGILDEPMSVEILATQDPSGDIVVRPVNCPFNTGGHGQRCKASHQNRDKDDSGDIHCPYSFDFSLAKKNVDWRCPEEVKPLIQALS